VEIKNNYFSEGNQIAEKTGKLEGGIQISIFHNFLIINAIHHSHVRDQSHA
jgi:hypothetical protein